MKIEKITIENYKAFYGKHEIHVGGKNMLIYGENGSGKSSLYYALNDYFERIANAHDNKLCLVECKNIFADNDARVQIEFSSTPGTSHTLAWENDATGMDQGDVAQILKRYAEMKAFLNGRRIFNFSESGFKVFQFILLKFYGGYSHNLSKTTFEEEVGELVELLKSPSKGNSGLTAKKRQKISNLTQIAQRLCLKINDDINKYIKYFDDRYDVVFEFSPTVLTDFINKNSVPTQRSANHLDIIEDCFKANLLLTGTLTQVNEPHKFLNEATKSAIGLSAFFCSVLDKLVDNTFKFAFFDDILVGIDMGHRQPVVRIIKEYFNDWQIFITTFDRAWYHLFSNQLRDNWSKMEMYSTQVKSIIKGREVGHGSPVMVKTDSDISKAHRYLASFDLPSAANHVRKAFEGLFAQEDESGKKLIPTEIKTEYDEASNNFDSTIPYWKLTLLLNKLHEYLEVLGEDLKTIEAIKNHVLGSVLHVFSHFNESDVIYINDLKKAISYYESLLKQLKEVRSRYCRLLYQKAYIFLTMAPDQIVKISCLKPAYCEVSNGSKVLGGYFAIIAILNDRGDYLSNHGHLTLLKGKKFTGFSDLYHFVKVTFAMNWSDDYLDVLQYLKIGKQPFDAVLFEAHLLLARSKAASV